MKKLIYFYAAFISCNLFAQNITVLDFGKAKSILRDVYGNKNKTFYCLCDYQKNSIKLDGCQIQIKKYQKRSKRLEWEHIVPAHAFGQSFKEWRDSASICGFKKTKKNNKKVKISNRKCAFQNKEYRAMEADLYNLFPAVGSVNAFRSNFSMIDFGDKAGNICGTDLVIQDRKISPPKLIRGDIARVYFYMNSAYPNRGIISQKNQILFDRWNKEDPISQEECDIYQLKKKYQKNINSFLESVCQTKVK